MSTDDDCADGVFGDAAIMPAGATPDSHAVFRPGPSKDNTERPGLARESLEHGEQGRFVVVTESGSRYLIDFTRQAFVRLPKDGEEHLWAMRGDGYPVRLLRLVGCVVGRRMQLRLDLAIPGIVFTDRQTTTVLAITEVSEGTDGRELDILTCCFGRGRDIAAGNGAA